MTFYGVMQSLLYILYRSYGAFGWRLVFYYKGFAPTEQAQNHIDNGSFEAVFDIDD